jgi:hypothetical protein
MLYNNEYNVMLCCNSKTINTYIVETTYLFQQNKRNSLLHVYGNNVYANAPQCYVTCIAYLVHSDTLRSLR